MLFLCSVLSLLAVNKEQCHRITMMTKETPVSIAMASDPKGGAKMAEGQSSLDPVSSVFVNAMCAIVIVCSLALCVWVRF